MLENLELLGKEEIIKQLKALAYEMWGESGGDALASELESFVRKTISQYASKLGFDELCVLKTIERKRYYSAANYYQQANFPELDNSVLIFETEEDVKNAFGYEFRCPACDKISKDPYECDQKPCDWKAYGFLRTAGRGVRFTIRTKFLENPRIDEIFYPVKLEKPGKVVNVKLGEKYDIYIGRWNKAYGLKKSIWANPFRIGKDGSCEEVLAKYRSRVVSDKLLMNSLKLLRGKILGCWCKTPENPNAPCHGDVLLSLVSELK